jgi:hypothetical protein
MTIPEFKTKLKTTPTAITFKETMQVIEDHYNFNPTAFTNGDTINNVGENYPTVLEDKNSTSHQNIRNFMQTDFKGLSFENEALTLKK